MTTQSPSPFALDPYAAPFGTFEPSAFLMAVRRNVIGAPGPYFFRRWLYKLFSHFTKGTNAPYDIEYLGSKFRIFIDENPQDKWVFRRGHHPEEEEFGIFDLYSNTNEMLFVDIGGNNGYFSVFGHTRLPQDARILAFEPHPRTYRKLLMNIAFNNANRVEPINVALGPEETVMTLRGDGTNNDGCYSLAHDSGKGIDVSVFPLHQALAERGVHKVDLLKIDVEGFEDRILGPFFQHAPTSLWPGRVIIETIHHTSGWEEDCIAMLKANGYEIENETRDNAWLVRNERGCAAT